MAAEKKSVASLVNLCHLLMKELGMPNMALQELLDRASATTELESFQSVMFWKYVTANICALEEKIAMGPFNPAMKKQGIIMKPQIPDLNQPAPGNEEPSELHLKPSVIMQGHTKVVEAEATTTTHANYSVVKRFKVTAENASPSNNNKGKGNLEMEGWGEN